MKNALQCSIGTRRFAKQVVVPKLAFCCIAIAALITTQGCATSRHANADPGITTAYVRESDDTLLSRFAPVFLVEHNEKSYNRIGTPAARCAKHGKPEVYVSPESPTVYEQVLSFETDKGRYTNLVYRVHFERSPFTWKPFNAGAGKNIGAMVVITLDERQLPVLVTTVQSCGCYHAITPTNFLPEEAYPEDWAPAGAAVYGETLPGRLDYRSPLPEEERIIVTIRDGVHRIKNLEVRSLNETVRDFPAKTMNASPIAALKTLPFESGTTSFYYTKGAKRGLVRGARKPLETVLFGLVAGDAHVGQDREYGPKEEVGRRFYTTLRASQKKRSDMWNYADYLRYNGWKP